MSKHDESGVPIIRPLKRSDPDLRKLARALIALAIAKNQADEQAAADEEVQAQDDAVTPAERGQK